MPDIKQKGFRKDWLCKLVDDWNWEHLLHYMTEAKYREQELLRIMDELIIALDPYQSDSTMRQIWLETHWLRHNLTMGQLVLPRWPLMIFKQPAELKRCREARLKARELVEALNSYAVFNNQV